MLGGPGTCSPQEVALKSQVRPLGGYRTLGTMTMSYRTPYTTHWTHGSVHRGTTVSYMVPNVQSRACPRAAIDVRQISFSHKMDITAACSETFS